jgi:hypothetical protein
VNIVISFGLALTKPKNNSNVTVYKKDFFFIFQTNIIRTHDHVCLERAVDLKQPRSGQKERLSQLQPSQAYLTARF